MAKNKNKTEYRQFLGKLHLRNLSKNLSQKGFIIPVVIILTTVFLFALFFGAGTAQAFEFKESYKDSLLVRSVQMVNYDKSVSNEPLVKQAKSLDGLFSEVQSTYFKLRDKSTEKQLFKKINGLMETGQQFTNIVIRPFEKGMQSMVTNWRNSAQGMKAVLRTATRPTARGVASSYFKITSLASGNTYKFFKSSPHISNNYSKRTDRFLSKDIMDPGYAEVLGVSDESSKIALISEPATAVNNVTSSWDKFKSWGKRLISNIVSKVAGVFSFNKKGQEGSQQNQRVYRTVYNIMYEEPEFIFESEGAARVTHDKTTNTVRIFAPAPRGDNQTQTLTDRVGLHGRRIENNTLRITNLDARFKNQDSRIKDVESDITSLDSRIRIQDLRMEDIEQQVASLENSSGSTPPPPSSGSSTTIINNNYKTKLTAGSNVFIHETDGGYTIESRDRVGLIPTELWTDSTESSTLHLNKTGASGNLVELEVGGTDTFVVDYGGDITLAGTTGITLSGNEADITFTGTGDHDLTASAGTLRIGSNVIIGDIQALDNTIDIGTPGVRFDNIYADEVNASTIVGTLTGGNLTAETFNINSDNSTADAEDSFLSFERGSEVPNALLRWDSTNDKFTFNSALELSSDISTATLTVPGLLTATSGANISDGTINLNNNSNNAVNIATGTSTGSVSIGGNANTVSIDSSDWDISTTGALTGISGITTDGGYTQSGTSVNTFSGATTFSAAGTALDVTNNASIGGTLDVTGAITGGTYNGQTISSTANFTGTVNVATSLTVPTLNATSAIQLNGSNINTGGTLSNVAYLDQANSFTQNQTINKANPSLVFNVSTATDTDFWIAAIDDAGSDDDDTLQIGDGTTPGTNPFLTIDTDGQVGIGTTGPSAPLHILGAAGSSVLKVRGDSSFHGVDIIPGASQGAAINFTQTSDQSHIQRAGVNYITLHSTGVRLNANLNVNEQEIIGIDSGSTAQGLVAIRGGNPGNTDNAGGNVTITGGTGDGAGDGGNVLIDGGIGGASGGAGDILLGATQGNVGIGTTGPEAKLHVYSASAGVVTPGVAGDDFVVEGSGNTGLSVLAPDTSEANIFFGSPSDNVSAFIRNEASDDLMTIGTASTGADFRFVAGNISEAVRILDNGNVGIGTTDPDGTLHVHTASSGAVTANVNADDLVVEGSVRGGISILTPNTDIGNIFFGDPDDNDVGVILYDHSDDSLRFRTNAVSDRVVIDSTGQVGIGTNSPAHTLDVNGDARVQDAIYEGSNADPVATASKADRTIHVDAASGDDNTGDGSVGSPYATISRAMQDVPEILLHDYTIQLAAGTYRETVVVNRSGKTPNASSPGASYATLTIKGDSATPSNYRITGADAGADTTAVRSFGALVESDIRVKFEGVKIDYTTAAGIYAPKSTRLILKDVTLSNNLYGVRLSDNSLLDLNSAGTINITGTGATNSSIGILTDRSVAIRGSSSTTINISEVKWGIHTNFGNLTGHLNSAQVNISNASKTSGTIGIVMYQNTGLHGVKLSVTNFDVGVDAANNSYIDLDSTSVFDNVTTAIRVQYNSTADVDTTTFTSVTNKYVVLGDGIIDATDESSVGKIITSNDGASNISDGASAVAYDLDTVNTLSTSGAKLLSLQNAAAEKFFIDKDGGGYFAGDVGIGTTSPTSLLHISGTENTTVGAGVGGGINLRIANQSTTANTKSTLDFSSNDSLGNLATFGRVEGIFVDRTDGTETGELAFYTRNASLQERMRIDSSGNIGIGTTSPSTALDVIGRIQTDDTIIVAENSSAVEEVMDLRNSDTSASAALRQTWKLGISGGVSNADALRMTVDKPQQWTTTLSTQDANLTFSLRQNGNLPDIAIFEGNTGRVGISNLAGATSNSLCYNTGVISGMNTFSTCSSSIRYKENISPLQIDKEKVLALEPVSFQWKNSENPGYLGVGFIAEEVVKHIPEIVTYKDGKIEGIEYKLLTPYIVGILKEHEQRINSISQGDYSDQQDLTVIDSLEITTKLTVKGDAEFKGKLYVDGQLWVRDKDFAGSILTGANGKTTISFDQPLPVRPAVSLTVEDTGFTVANVDGFEYNSTGEITGIKVKAFEPSSQILKSNIRIDYRIVLTPPESHEALVGNTGYQITGTTDTSVTLGPTSDENNESGITNNEDTSTTEETTDTTDLPAQTSDGSLGGQATTTEDSTATSDTSTETTTLESTDSTSSNPDSNEAGTDSTTSDTTNSKAQSSFEVGTPISENVGTDDTIADSNDTTTSTETEETATTDSGAQTTSTEGTATDSTNASSTDTSTIDSTQNTSEQTTETTTSDTNT